MRNYSKNKNAGIFYQLIGLSSMEMGHPKE
jgi:hypothetical protein